MHGTVDEGWLAKLRDTLLTMRKAAAQRDAARLERQLQACVSLHQQMQQQLQKLGRRDACQLQPVQRLCDDLSACVHALSSLLVSASYITAQRTLSNKGRLVGICELDACIGSLVYACCATGSIVCTLGTLLQVRVLSLPLVGKHSEGRRLHSEFKHKYVHPNFAPNTAKKLETALRGDTRHNTLLALHRAIWREALMIVQPVALEECRRWSSPTGKRRSRRQQRRPQSSSKGEPICPGPFTQQWWDTCRRWPCHMLAYAVPNRDALWLLASLAPIVDWGAGTGYWASLLHDRGVEAYALDSCPPAGNTGAKNEFHGQTQAFTSVLHASDASALKQYSHCTLLLCYAPNDTTMGKEALQHFTGNAVVHVGEFRGDSGDPDLEQILLWSGSFKLEKEISLPNFANTAYALTLWRRQQPALTQKEIGFHLSQMKLCPFACSQCGRTENLKRCAWCRVYVFCSLSCFQALQREHAAEHASRLLFWRLDSKQAFADPHQFRPIEN